MTRSNLALADGGFGGCRFRSEREDPTLTTKHITLQNSYHSLIKRQIGIVTAQHVPRPSYLKEEGSVT